MTDGKFHAAMRSASRAGTLYFTKNQLYGAYCRKMRADRVSWIALACTATTLAFIMFLTAFWVPLAIVCMLVPYFIYVACTVSAKPMSMKHFMGLVDRWQAAGKPIERLIDGPTLHDPPPSSSESDLYDYGVEKILLVQRDELVDWFVLNHIHAEQRSLVIAESGYPKYLLPTAERLLRQRPDLPIHLLHDATPEGMGMEGRLPDVPLPTAGHPVLDLGLTPGVFQRLRRTSVIDRKNRGRELPVDVLPLTTLATGMVIAQQRGETIIEFLSGDGDGDADGDFG
ncbi:MAG: hypothetical protein AAF958_05035 [Planctomycetota bacterium]